jgi:lysophospholipase L1-like esterase
MTGSSIGRVRHFALIALLFCASTGAGLVISELTCRVFHLSKTYEARPTLALSREIDRDAQPYRYLPGRSWSSAYGAAYRSNRGGFRDRDFDLVKPLGITRIAVLGDSVAEGLGVAEGQRFSSNLETTLNGIEPGRYEVMNFALSGYSTANEALVLERAVLSYSPDLVILQVCFNDLKANDQQADDGSRPQEGLRPRSRDVRGPLTKFKSFLAQNSALYLVLAERWNGYRLSRGLPTHLLQDIHGTTERQLQATATLIRQIASSCARRNIRFLVVYVPQEVEVRIRSVSMATWLDSQMARMCETLGVQFLSVLASLRRESSCSAFIDDCHLSPCGHAVVGRDLGTRILTSTLFGAREEMAAAARQELTQGGLIAAAAASSLTGLRRSSRE